MIDSLANALDRFRAIPVLEGAKPPEPAPPPVVFPESNETQARWILRALRRAGPAGMTSVQFVERMDSYTGKPRPILKYTNRISDLRRKGYDIKAERVAVRSVDGRNVAVWNYTLREAGRETGNAEGREW